MVNIVSALATTLGAVLFFQLGQSFEISLDAVLGLVAGFFIYIAVSDIIPSIHENEEMNLAGVQSILLVIGAIVVGLLTANLHQYIDQGHEHEHESHSIHDDHENEKHHGEDSEKHDEDEHDEHDGEDDHHEDE